MKKLLATLLLGAALTVGALPAAAAGTDGTVTMQPDGDRAAVTLSVPEGADQDATALRLRFQVEGQDATASFAFADGLTSTVQQYRYDAATGTLTLYLAGQEALLQDGSVALGEICLSAAPGTSATVQVVEDSLELVNAAYNKTGVTQATGTEVTLTVPGGNPTPEQTLAPEQTPAPVPQPEQTPAPGVQATPMPTAAPSGGGNTNGNTQVNNGNNKNGGNTRQEPTPTPVVSTTPVYTAAPQPAGTTTQSGKSSSTGKGSTTQSGNRATPAPSATPEPSAQPAASASPAPSATPAPTPATAETAQAETPASGGLPLPALLAVAVVILALLGVVILRLRNR